ncbi:DUF6318 family protein [Arthrobacter rhombi]|uniref:DUF6318 family protein n=1 Tax=Arthrobacter rhombi TaxID=71253 RepID=UPI003FD29C87
MPVTIARKTLSRFAVGVAIAIALSACSASDGAETTNSSDDKSPSAPASPSTGNKDSSTAASPTTESASPTPIAASSDGPAKNWPVPKMPAKAKKKTLKGAAAFAEYYFSLIEYTSTTTKTGPIKRHTLSACSSCQDDIIAPSDHNRKNHAWNAGGTYNPTITAAQDSKAGYIAVAFRYMQSKRTVYDAAGKINEVYDPTEEPVYGTFRVTWDGGWKLQAIDIVRQ